MTKINAKIDSIMTSFNYCSVGGDQNYMILVVHDVPKQTILHITCYSINPPTNQFPLMIRVTTICERFKKFVNGETRTQKLKS